MKKTAMQLLLLKAEMDGYNRPQWWWKEQIENLLETEREQIEEAFKQSRKRISMFGESEIEMNDYLIEAKFKDAEQYYKETYG